MCPNIFWNFQIRMIWCGMKIDSRIAAMANYMSALIYKLNFVLVAHLESVRFVPGLRQYIWVILI
jgi:hypothetical protein